MSDTELPRRAFGWAGHTGSDQGVGFPVSDSPEVGPTDARPGGGYFSDRSSEPAYGYAPPRPSPLFADPSANAGQPYSPYQFPTPEPPHLPSYPVAQFTRPAPTKGPPLALILLGIVVVVLITSAGVYAATRSDDVETHAPRYITAADEQRLFVESEPSVVKVTATVRSCGYVAYGSGFFVSPDTAVTNAHVVAGSNAVVVRTSDAVEHDAYVTAFDPTHDIAIVKIPTASGRPLELVDRNPPTGEGVIALGYPESGPYQRSTGWVRTADAKGGTDIYDNPTPNAHLIVLADIGLRPGNSGGPVLDPDGRVIGIATAKPVLVAPTGYAVPWDLVAKNLASQSSGRVGTGPCLRR